MTLMPAYIPHFISGQDVAGTSGRSGERPRAAKVGAAMSIGSATLASA